MKKKQKEWWKETFDGKYLATYVDIVTPEKTKKQINFLIKILKNKKGAKNP